MIETTIFERASRSKTRFPYKGMCSVEDLWDLNVHQLDYIYKSLNTQLRAEEMTDSLLSSENETSENETSELELQVSIIRHIVSVKLADAEVVRQEHARWKKQERIMSILADKQDAGLAALSEEELAKMLED